MIWLLIATVAKLPVSGTHSIVGAMVGFHVVVFQFAGINWKQLAMIGKFQETCIELKPLVSQIQKNCVGLLYIYHSSICTLYIVLVIFSVNNVLGDSSLFFRCSLTSEV